MRGADPLLGTADADVTRERSKLRNRFFEVLSAGVMYDESPERGGAAGAETTETSRGEGRLRLPRPAT
jgi:hypothetical protein